MINTEVRSCVKVEVDVLGSPSLIVPVPSLWMKSNITLLRTKLRSCVKVEVDVLGSTSLKVLMVSVDEVQHLNRKKRFA